ncbi:MAG: hypothetical protein ACREBP_01425 [Sphingomicrobium sp.]
MIGYVKYNIARQVGIALERNVKPSRKTKEINVHLLREVEKFLRQSDVAPTRFGRDAVGDPRFVYDLRNGRDPRPGTVARVIAYLESAQ